MTDNNRDTHRQDNSKKQQKQVRIATPIKCMKELRLDYAYGLHISDYNFELVILETERCCNVLNGTFTNSILRVDFSMSRELIVETHF